MTEPTISIVYITSSEREFLKESLESTKPIADEICIIVDKLKTDKETWEIICNFKSENPDILVKTFEREWDTGTKQKQFAIEQATMQYILCLDADEILSDNCIKLKEILIDNSNIDAFSIKGHHFIYNLCWEDDTVENHYWDRRLFKNHIGISMEGVNHAITKGANSNKNIDEVRIFHMGYVKQLTKIMDRYEENFKFGLQIHTPQFLEWWKDTHVLGYYPIKRFDLDLLPKTIINKFKIKDNVFKLIKNLEESRRIEQC